MEAGLLPIGADVGNLFALEGDLRVSLDGEEIVREQVLVALRVVRVDAGDIDRAAYRCLLGLSDVELDRALKAVEPALGGREQVPDAEADAGVRASTL